MYKRTNELFILNFQEVLDLKYHNCGPDPLDKNNIYLSSLSLDKDLVDHMPSFVSVDYDIRVKKDIDPPIKGSGILPKTVEECFL